MRSKFIFLHVVSLMCQVYHEEQQFKMLVVFLTIFVANTKITFDYNFVAPLKTGSEVEFLISSGTFFQSGLGLYTMLSKSNFFVLGFCFLFWDSEIQISENFSLVGIFSEFKYITHDIRRQGIQVFINFNHKEFYTFLVHWFFICIRKKYYEIIGAVLLNKVQAQFMYVVNSTNCAKHPY